MNDVIVSLTGQEHIRQTMGEELRQHRVDMQKAVDNMTKVRSLCLLLSYRSV